MSMLPYPHLDSDNKYEWARSKLESLILEVSTFADGEAPGQTIENVESNIEHVVGQVFGKDSNEYTDAVRQCVWNADGDDVYVDQDFEDDSNRSLSVLENLRDRLEDARNDFKALRAAVPPPVKEVEPEMTQSESTRKARPKKPQSDEVTVEKLSLGELLRRMRVSTIWRVCGSLVVLLTGAYGLGTFVSGVGNEYAKSRAASDADSRERTLTEHIHELEAQLESIRARSNAAEQQHHGFNLQFATRSTLHHLVPSILEESPDGLETYEEGMGSLLWQAKSQQGFAQFLAGEKSISVQVVYSDDGLGFEWDHAANPLPTILTTLGVESTPEVVSQLNAELNVFGVCFLANGDHVIRDFDGGLVVVGSDSE